MPDQPSPRSRDIVTLKIDDLDGAERRKVQA